MFGYESCQNSYEGNQSQAATTYVNLNYVKYKL